jgi:hypothetical protein
LPLVLMPLNGFSRRVDKKLWLKPFVVEDFSINYGHINLGVGMSGFVSVRSRSITASAGHGLYAL